MNRLKLPMAGTARLPSRRLQRLLATGLAILAAAPHLALSEEAKDGHSIEQSTTLPTVTVNARLSSESAKEVPFSVSVIGGEQLEERRLLNLEDALRSSPGVDVNSSGGFNDVNVRIRGVGSLYQVSSEDSSVVIHLDGVPLSSRNASLANMDIERVEVLKGPQGTLFGRNSEAGAINVVSRRPTREREGYVRAEAGEEGQYLTEAAVGGPLSETLSARVALRGAGADSPVINSRDGKPLVEAKDRGARLSVLWQPAAATSALFIAEHQDQQGRAGLMVPRPYAEPPALDLTPSRIRGDNTQDRHSVEINHDLGGSRITSVTSYTASDTDFVGAYDRVISQALFGTPIEYYIAKHAEDEAWNQDLRWSSLPGAATFWVAGLNLAKSDRRIDDHDLAIDARRNRRFGTESGALYGEATWPLSAALKLTTGLRHTWERKTYAARFLGSGPATRDARHLSDNYSTGRVALSYALDPRTNLHGVVARGYKTGGFNDYTSQVADGEPYKPAVANSFEIGFKHESTDRRFMLNGAAFLNRVKDDHMLGYDVATFATQALNADTESKGVELEGNWRIDGGWTLAAGLTYLDAKITRSVAGVSGGDVAAGNRVPDVARWSASLSVAWRRSLPEFLGLAAPALNARLSVRHVGRRAADPQNHFDLGAYDKLDLRVGVASGSTEVYVWGDNLLDERYDLYGYQLAPAVMIGMPSRGRTVGVGAALYF